MKLFRQSDYVSLIAAVGVHLVFGAQATLAAVKTGGMVLTDAFFWGFLPHCFLMFFLPPAWPVTPGSFGQHVHIDWLRLAGKLAVAFPASLIYGLVIGALWSLVVGKTSKHKP